MVSVLQSTFTFNWSLNTVFFTHSKTAILNTKALEAYFTFKLLTLKLIRNITLLVFKLAGVKWLKNNAKKKKQNTTHLRAEGVRELVGSNSESNQSDSPFPHIDYTIFQTTFNIVVPMDQPQIRP